MVEADIAVYEAKEGGRDRYCVYAPSGDQPSEAEISLAWSERIRNAHRRRRAHAPCAADPQPGDQRRSPSTSSWCGWSGPDGELLPPHAFLPSAERSGMVQEIDPG